jgi:LysM repeat protein
MADPTCHYCDRPAEEQCPTCGRLYCPEHGDDICLRCMAPESATPGSLMYRGSLLALVVASLIAIFLFVRPPESKSTGDSVRTLATSTSSSAATATPTPPGGNTTRSATPQLASTATPQPSGTAGASTTAQASTTPSAKTYTVVSGDTLSGIAAANNTTLDALQALNPGITPQTLGIGTVLKLP